MPKISVIMGIYNTKSKEYLKRSLESILNQTYADFEFIICDDGSTNDCIKWAKEICKNDKRVIFISNNQNRGLAHTLNHCLAKAKGEYIARMDDDDESDTKRFEKQIRYLEQHPDIDLVSCNICLFDSDGIYGYKNYPEVITKKDFLFNSPVVHPAIMAKKESFDKVNGYCEESYCVRVEDYDLFMRMFAKGIHMSNLQEQLFNYRDDRQTVNRRQKYKYRINEAKIRFQNFRKLHLFPLGIFYVFKPLVVGLFPAKLIFWIKKGGKDRNERQN